MNRPPSPAPQRLQPMPPMRGGVSASQVVLQKGPWRLLSEALHARLPKLSAPAWEARIASGAVLNEHQRPFPKQAVFEGPTRVWYYREPLAPEVRVPFDIQIVFEDEHLVVIDKPHFLPVSPKGQHVHETALVRLKNTLGIETLVPAHRLDRETAGLLLFTKRPQDRHAYQSLFAHARIRKEYAARCQSVAGAPETLLERVAKLPSRYCSRLVEREGDGFMQMVETDGPPNTETGIRVEKVEAAWVQVALHPTTGKKHQLRAHMSALGLPILNDRIYPRLWTVDETYGDGLFERPLKLLARRLAFTDPITGEQRDFCSELTLDGG